MPNCPDRETLSDFTDGALPALRRWRVQRHVRGCAACAHVLAAERQMNAAAKGYLASAAAPASLRAAVLAALTARTATVPHVSPRPFRLRRAATLATALSLAAFGLFAVLRRPTPHGVLPGLPPAYGEVAKSMARIRTAQWTVTYDIFEAQTGKKTHIVTRMSARMTPPALRTETVGEPAWRAEVQTPQTPLFRMMYRLRFPEGDRASHPQFSYDVAMRRYILTDLLPPATIEQGGWHRRLVRHGGKSFWRYEAGLGEARRLAEQKQSSGKESFSFDHPRLTRSGYRWTIWVAPGTRRLVRSESEYYDGQRHDLTVSDNFVYDQPLPNALFRPTHLPAKK